MNWSAINQYFLHARIAAGLGLENRWAITSIHGPSMKIEAPPTAGQAHSVLKDFANLLGTGKLMIGYEGPSYENHRLRS